MLGRTIATITLLAVLLTGCTATGGGVGDTAPAETSAGSDDFSSATVEAFVAELAEAGIGVYRGDELVAPVTGQGPMRLTEEQAANAALSAWSHSGLSGREVDKLVPAEPLIEDATPIPTSLLIIAWAQTAPGAAASLARSILGDQDWSDWEDVTIAPIVLGLFVADVVPGDVAAGSGGMSVPAARGEGAPASPAKSVCERVRGFVGNTIEAVFAKIGHIKVVRADGGSWLGDALTFIRNLGAVVANFAIDKVKSVIISGVELALRPILNAVASVAGVVAVATQILLIIRPWAGILRPEPVIPQRDASTHEGTVTLTVRGVGDAPREWPTEIAGCARAAGVELPSLIPQSADVTWSIAYQHPAPMITRVSDSGPLRTDSTATLRFETIPETPEVAEGVEQIDGRVHVTALVHRKDLDRLHEGVTNFVFAQVPVPAIVAPALRKVVAPMIQELIQKVTRLRDITVFGVVPVNYHTPDEDATAASPAPSVPVRRAVLPTLCPNVAAAAFGYRDPAQADEAGSRICWYIADHNTYQLGIGILEGAAADPDIVGAEQVSIPGADNAWIDTNCTSAAGPCYSIQVAVGTDILLITGSPSREEVIALAKRVLGVG